MKMVRPEKGREKNLIIVSDSNYWHFPCLTFLSGHDFCFAHTISRSISINCESDLASEMNTVSHFPVTSEKPK